MTGAEQPPLSLLHAVTRWIIDEPAREAMAFGDVRLSYGDLAGHALALADRLQQLGVRPGDRVAAIITPRPEAVIAYLGCWIAGATLTGITPRLRQEEQRLILTDCGATVLLAVEQEGARDLRLDLDAHASDCGTFVLRIGKAFGAGDLPPPVPTDQIAQRWQSALEAFEPQVPAVIIHTSGSTGKPKGALITHAGLAFRAWTMHHDRFDLPHIRQLVDLPVNHIGALASGIGVSLVAGGFMVMAEQFNPAFTLDVTARERLDVLSGVPPMLARVVDHPDFDQADLSSVRFVNWGAGPIGARVLDRLLEATSARFTQQYGMTESNGPIVYTPPTRDRAVLLETTGKPDPRLDVRIADGDDRPLAPGEEGEVQVRQPCPFAGYLDNPQATRDALTADGFLRTGDLAKIRGDGYLVFCGRSKEMFKSGGFNVYPREIEILLESHPEVRAAAVLGVDDEQWGQVGHAFVELSGDTTTDELAAWCKERLANYKVPKRFSVIAAMPRTPVDKVDRMALLALARR